MFTSSPCTLMSHTTPNDQINKCRCFTMLDFCVPARGHFLQCIKVLTQIYPDSADVRQNCARKAPFYLLALSSFPVSHAASFHGCSTCRKRFALSSSIELDRNLEFCAAHTARSVSSGVAPNAPKPAVVNSRGKPNIIARSASQNIL